MAWTYLAESVESLSPWLHGSEQLPIVKTIDTLKASCSIVCDSAISRALQSGTTSELSKAMLCPWCRISCLEVFPAKTSVLQDMAAAWKASARAYSYTWRALRKKSVLLSSFWKMSRRFEQGDLVWSASSWPAWGTISGGRLFQPQKLEPNTSADVGSSLLPTPTAKHYGSNKGGGKGRVGASRHSIHQMATRGILPGHPKGSLNREYLEQVMGYPSQWTVIGDLETQWFLSRQEQPSKD
jgi:hypothetical protein